MVLEKRPVKQMVDDPDLFSNLSPQSKFKKAEEAGILMTSREAIEYGRRKKMVVWKMLDGIWTGMTPATLSYRKASKGSGSMLLQSIL